MKNADLFINENDFPDFPYGAADEHLRGAIQCPTVSYVDTSRVDYTAFDRLHERLKAAYPLITRYGTWEIIGHSLLITLKGTDESLRPGLFMAHQDVVPVVPGTEGNWRHDPFSGDLAEGFIWGRGAMDIKQMLISELEAAEYWLSKGLKPRRTLYLAFGEDEETLSRGVTALRDTLKVRGVTLEFVLDEGAGDVTDAADWGAPGTLLCSIGLYEKGYCDLTISAKSKGGHSSNPFHGTSLGNLARAIAAILDHPTRPVLPEAAVYTLKALKGRITQPPLRDWAKDIPAHEEEILQYFLSRESLYHLVTTTAAPTMISGGAPAGNVMPQDMTANINFRLIPADTPESLLEHCREAAGDGVTLEWAQQIGASRPSEIGSFGYNALVGTLKHYFDRMIFVPTQNKGATDARHYEDLCRSVMRFGPFLEEEDISSEGVHGTNERISLRAFHQGLRVITRFMYATCFGNEDDLTHE